MSNSNPGLATILVEHVDDSYPSALHEAVGPSHVSAVGTEAWSDFHPKMKKSLSVRIGGPGGFKTRGRSVSFYSPAEAFSIPSKGLKASAFSAPPGAAGRGTPTPKAESFEMVFDPTVAVTPSYDPSERVRTEETSASPPTLAQLFKVRRDGARARCVYGAPRGKLTEAAESRALPADLSLYERVLVEPDEAPLRAAAADVLGEVGGPDQVPVLGRVLLPVPAAVRRSAATALGVIGGPRAAEYLVRAVESPELSDEVRMAALASLLDLVSDGWDAYLMSGHRIAMPAKVRSRLDAIPAPAGELADALADALHAFDE